ncbi:WAS/WASL-interacting protein family member 1-like [Amphibalanus amphitrite]|uniref:WAS/WASL-interacting protein family member 1-like n=1 Tax=Amphibalanus amphitrite TaxID=1232801 RepID=UPI001C91E1C1|nr:WAS/WASL-interacting protein family member 1-like [Amphibalanus amphitrite]
MMERRRVSCTFGSGGSPHRQPASRYIDAFGEIVGLPSPRSACDEPESTAGELQYGPGIVSRLCSRYQSMAGRVAATPCDEAMRRAASLQDLLRREGAFERGALQDSYLLTGGGALSAPPAWAESIRKAKSVGDLPLQDSLPARKSSLPTADTVSNVKRLFEPPSGGGGGGGGPLEPEKGSASGGGRPAGADALFPPAADDVPVPADRPMTVNMVGMVLSGGRPVATGPVLPDGPVTRASLAAAVKRSSPPLTGGDPARFSSAQAVNARLISAAAETSGEATGNGAGRPPAPVNTTLAWHQRVNNSILYNFTDRSEVPDYIEDDGMDIHRPAKPKPNDTAYVLLAGFEHGQTSDDDVLPAPLPPPEPPACPVEFTNAGVIINGQSSLRRQPRESTRAVWFSELSPRVFRYPSESTLLEAQPPEPEPPRSETEATTGSDEDWNGTEESDRPAPSQGLLGSSLPANPAAKPSTLSTYTSSRLATEEAAAFQLGVTRASRPPAPSVPAPAPPSAPAPAQPDEEDAAWSAETTADMLF